MTSNIDFSSQFFRANRQRLLKVAKTDLVVIPANGLLQNSADLTFDFRQDSNFWYLTGIDEPDVILVCGPKEEFLIASQRDKIRAVFEGQVDTAVLSRTAGISDVMDEAAGWARLTTLLKNQGQVGVLSPPRAFITAAGFYANPARARLARRLKSANPRLKLIGVGKDLAGLRAIKQPSELAAIQKAIDVTAAAFKDVLGRLNGFKYEYELQAAIDYGFQNRGARPAFPTIAAGGKNACTLHYTANKRRLATGQLVLLDAGAEVNNYAGDLTRTFAMSAPTPRQQAVYQSVIAVQAFAISQLKPGLKFKDYGQAVDKFMGMELRSLGLVKKPNHEEIKRYFPHGVSHFLGLDVHDPADYTQPLAAGMVLTVEPGIYIPEEAIGIRLEDNVLITKSGAQVLSSGLPKELQPSQLA